MYAIRSYYGLLAQLLHDPVRRREGAVGRRPHEGAPQQADHAHLAAAGSIEHGMATTRLDSRTVSGTQHLGQARQFPHELPLVPDMVARITSYNVCYTKLLRSPNRYKIPGRHAKTLLIGSLDGSVLFLDKYPF